ncbi:M14 family zinc carboxypeptidase [Patulibacter americanus]|uniref:M14 family zinc carboxypeptidase n=1 Tax=Patulibacter americanus TaxID=588672 RepID=UPI0003B6C117|nr:M14 family zinc carboxypeptidase [Patulibacter americanus]
MTPARTGAPRGGRHLPPAAALGLAAAGLAVVALAAPAVVAAPAAAAATSRACPVVAGARAVPAARQVLGHRLTASAPTPGEVDAYLLALDAASPRITTVLAGRTPEGRPLRYALLGDPDALRPAALAATSAAVRAVRAGRTGRAAVSRAARRPAVVWIGAGVHANEPSGTTAALALLARMAASNACADRRTLRGTLAVVVPDQNPDGRVLGTRTNAADIDLNRDWFAASQPETRARLRTLERFPPVLAIDAHEQTGGAYFAPPYASPVVAGLPRAIRRFADGPVSAAVDAALRRGGPAAEHGGYDLLYPGYADSATSLLYGAGGMTFEQGSDPSLQAKTVRHETALHAALGAVARRRVAAVRAWASGFAAAVRNGRAGRGTTGDRTYGWVLRTDAHAADATALATRLRATGVRVRALRRATRLRIDPLGPPRARRALLPAGTLVVPAAQPLGRWADVLLGRDADEAGRASGGSDTWSAPRLAGVAAAALRAPLPASASVPFAGPRAPRVADGATVSFAADSAAAARLAVAALGAGRPVARTPDGRFRTVAPEGWARAAARTGVAVRAATGAPDTDAGAVALRAPRVAVLPDLTPLMQGPPALLPVRDRPAGWLRDALRAAGAAPQTVLPDALSAGVPAGVTHLVLGPGIAAALRPAARDAVVAWVRAGGTALVVDAAGVEAAWGLGLTRVVAAPAAGRAAVSVSAVPGTDAVGRTLGPDATVVVAGQPRLHAPPGAAVPLRAARGAALAPSGAVGAADGLAGRPLVVDEAFGAGHVLTLGFSPAFRRQSDGGERVLLGLLLAPR